ncbi:MAG: CHAP domain-containing protein, partial [Candidatus Saccharimonadales bacterium]
IVAIFALLIGFYSDVFAQNLSNIHRQIESVNREISQSESRIEELRRRENTLQNRLAVLDAEARQLEQEISRTKTEITKTRAEITEKEKELARTKEMIQESAKTLYKQGDPSTIEILFSSENFTDFINKREYLDRVKTSLNEAAKEAVLLKGELEEKETELNFKSRELSGQRVQLTSRQEEQKRLIEETQGEESRYQEIVENQRGELQRLEEEQRRAYDRFLNNFNPETRPGDPSRGSYPDKWHNAPINSMADDWGMFNRQCTSYAAWRVANDGKFMPRWGNIHPFPRGNARYWPTHAISDDIPVNNTPKIGAIAVWGPNQFGMSSMGHLAYVEQVNGDGSIWVSQYNVIAGQYNEMRVPSSQAPNLRYIHF